MTLPFTTNFDLTGTSYTLIHAAVTANPIFMETKQGHIEYAIAATGTAPTTLNDIDGHDVPKGQSQEINLGAGESLFVKATAGDARISCTGG